MPTRKTISWLLAAFVLYMIAWNIVGGWLYAIIAILVAFPLGSMALNRLNTRSVEISLEAPDRGAHGDDLQVLATVENASRFPRFLLRLSCQLAGSEASLFLVQAGGRRDETFSFTMENVRRGVYGGGEVELSSRAPIGLARSRRRLHAACPVVVYPHWITLAADWTTGGHSRGATAASLTPVRNPSCDYLGVRDYRPEDSPRSIHWKTTARSNDLAVIEYSHQVTMTPVFLVDQFREAAIGRPDEDSFEVAVSIAASLIQREAAFNRRFGCGTSLADALSRGLGHDPEAAMLLLADLQADHDEPLAMSGDEDDRAGITPVLIVTSHVRYGDIDRSDFIERHPGVIVIMIDGRPFTTGSEESARLLDDTQLEGLGKGLETAGCGFLLIDSTADVAACLEEL